MDKDAADGADRKNRLKGDLPTRALVSFVLLTLAISWGIAGFFIFLPSQAEAMFGKLSGLHPLYFLMAWGPGIAGLALVTFYGGLSGLRAFLSRLLLWRCGAQWWALILVGLPLVYVAGSLIKGGSILADLPEEGLGAAVLVTLLMLFLGPVEEFGWRGVAQPILQRHVAPIWAGLIVGLVWGAWHIPAFFLSGVVYENWDFTSFLVGNAALAILVTPIFNASRGSLLLPILFHWQLIVPFWPDAQPWDTWLFVGLTAVIVALTHRTMFSRLNAVTRVIPASE